MISYTTLPAEFIPPAYLERQRQQAIEADRPLVAHWAELEHGLAAQDPDQVDRAYIAFGTHVMRGMHERRALEGSNTTTFTGLLAAPLYRARAERQTPNRTTVEQYNESLGVLATIIAGALPATIEKLDINEQRNIEQIGTLCSFAALNTDDMQVYVASPREKRGRPAATPKSYHDMYALEMHQDGLLKVPIITHGRGATIFSEDLDQASSLRLPFSRLLNQARKLCDDEPVSFRSGLYAIGRTLRNGEEPRDKAIAAALVEVARRKFAAYKETRSLLRRWDSPAKRVETPKTEDPHAKFLGRLAVDRRVIHE